MSHKRPRYLLPALLKALKFSPIVGILGQRQSGKTTLMRSVVGASCVSLDDRDLLAAADLSPKSFVARDHAPFGIDECQLSPGLFPALKLRVQDHPRVGQFVLTGSVRFTSRKAIRESLTGRIFNLELLPLMISESHELGIQDTHALAHGSFAKLRASVLARCKLIEESDLEGYLKTGGLPGICFHRDVAIRQGKWATHLETLLARDLMLVLKTTLSTLSIRNVLAYLAAHQARAFSIADLSRQTRVSMQTLNKLLHAFESLFLIRRIAGSGDRRKPVFYFEDQGLASFLHPVQEPELDRVRLAFSQLHSQIRYLYPAEGSISSFETRGGARVPIVIKAHGKITGCIPISSEAIDRSALLSAQSFLKAHLRAQVLILTRGDEVVNLGGNINAVPLRGVV
jgi:predicted AAA+ superfamily ATPase